MRILITTMFLVVHSIATSHAAQPWFIQRDINPDSKYSASAVFDVNHDDKLDIVCGGFWYEAPAWKRHKIRDVEMIRGRYDGYSHCVIDMNGDGWHDFVECNYRSSSIYWIEHPGAGLGEWTKHVIELPGPMETGRLVDVNGDGKMDLLPNGVRFAAWWEITPGDPKKDTKPEWLRHDLPIEVATHGSGFGDINGDGRGDIVCPNGWLEAPEDRRKGRWVFHPEFKLHRDGSTPIFVHDIDEDGDGDVIWCRAHSTGVYWLEQSKDADGDRQWTRHVIDTSYSQSHSPRLRDIDGDGNLELITGKRYMAHDGKDPGAYDPLVIYYYDFHPAKKTWSRNKVSFGTQAGFGLDSSIADIDGDKDMDLIVCGRSGLFLLENQHVAADDAVQVNVPPIPLKYDHSKLLEYSVKGELKPVESPADWGIRRNHILRGMEKVMGVLPTSERRVPLDIEIVREEKLETYTRQRITFASELRDRVPAYLLIPHKIEGKAPAMLCLHQTTKIGKGEPAGIGGKATLDYAHELAERGFVCIALDYPSFGDYPYDFNADDYSSGTMKAIWNNIRAIDVLETLPYVNHDKIGAIGHSLGGHNALFTAPFDLRIKAVVTSCGFTAFHHYYKGKLAGWTSDRYMPRIRDTYKNDPDRMPFDFYEVLATIAPRAIFVNAPLHDGNFEVTGVQKVVEGASKVFELNGAADKLRAEYPDSGHDFPDDVRKQSYEWLEKLLK